MESNQPARRRGVRSTRSFSVRSICTIAPPWTVMVMDPKERSRSARRICSTASSARVGSGGTAILLGDARLAQRQEDVVAGGEAERAAALPVDVGAQVRREGGDVELDLEAGRARRDPHDLGGH